MSIKKITALCLTAAITFSSIITPVIAAPKVNNNISKEVKGSIVITYEKPDKSKNNKNDFKFKFSDSKDLLETMGWAIKSIEKLGAKGIISGYEGNMFKPQNKVTNLEALAMVLKLTGKKEVSESNDKVHPQLQQYKNQWKLMWGWGYLFVAIDEGILLPEEIKDFNPNKPVKRHEIAKYIIRAIGKTNDAEKNMNSELTFKDKAAIPKDSWGYVYVVNELGIMTGVGNDQFKPNEPLTRAELAVIIDKADDKFETPDDDKDETQVEFVSYDYKNNTLEVELYNGKKAYYKTLSNVIVYKDKEYTDVDSLVKGDILEIVLNNNKEVIFIEVVKEKAIKDPVKVEEIDFDVVSSSLPKVIESKVESLKTSSGYKTYEYDGDIYLAAFMGKKNTGGYSISIDEVYKYYLGNGKYRIEAVVGKIEPDKDSIVTQAITYPYEVVKFDKFDKIEKVVFVDEKNKVLAQRSLEDLNEENIITGKISLLDEDEEYIKVLVDNKTYKYNVTDDVEIFIDNKKADFEDLKINMPVKLTIVNDVVVKISIDYSKKEISGTISYLDKNEEYIKVLVNKIYYKYNIADDVEILINNEEADFEELKVDIPVKLTVVNDMVVKISADYNKKEVTGTIQYINEKTKEIRIKIDSKLYTYSILSDVEIILNEKSAQLSDLKYGMTVSVELINSKVSKIDAVNTEEIYEGMITSLEISKNTAISIFVNVDDGSKKRFEIDKDTKITINGKRAKAEDLAINSEVIITMLNNKVVEIVEK